MMKEKIHIRSAVGTKKNRESQPRKKSHMKVLKLAIRMCRAVLRDLFGRDNAVSAVADHYTQRYTPLFNPMPEFDTAFCGWPKVKNKKNFKAVVSRIVEKVKKFRKELQMLQALSVIDSLPWLLNKLEYIKSRDYVHFGPSLQMCGKR